MPSLSSQLLSFVQLQFSKIDSKTIVTETPNGTRNKHLLLQW